MQHACVVISVLAIAGVCEAGIAQRIVQTRTFSGPQPRSYEFQRADALSPGPGMTLERVTLTLELTVSGGGLSIDNDGPEAGSVNVFFLASLSVASDDITLPAASTTIILADRLEVEADDEHPGGPPVFDDDGGPDTASMPPVSGETSQTVMVLEEAFLDQFRSGVPFTLNVTPSTNFGISGLPSVAGVFQGLSIDNASITLAYGYVPAPGGLALFSCAALGRRRGRSQF